MRSRLPVIGISLAVALLTLIPYGLVYASAGEYRFTGFLFNPYDAASYLAKMRQGYEGQILYSLAFTEAPGPGALFFTYYILLGHLARLLHFPLIVIWHIARILGGAFFLTAAWEFFGRIGLSTRGRRIAWIILLLGSGFGFLAVPLGAFTADLWVAEYIPFLGLLTSAHFPLASGLILLLAVRIALLASRPTALSLAAAFVLGTALAAIQPFGFLPLGMALAAWMAWMRVARGRFPEGALQHLAAAGFGFLPWAVYDFWVTRNLPKFAMWFTQNQTPTPPVWDVALSMGLPGVIVCVSFIRWIFIRAPMREKLTAVRSESLLAALWLAINLALLYAPIPLQRRLMLGMWIPLAALAAPKLESLLFGPALRPRHAVYTAISLGATNLVFLAAVGFNALGRNPLLFLSPDAAAAVDWLNANARGSVVLASPEYSAWLPGMAGARVVYGHGMETPDAGRALADVETFFASVDEELRARILSDRQVDLVLCSTDQAGCPSPEGGPLVEVFSSGNISIFAVR
ncbi:MAG: hypothetical protein JW748_11615 [Anaerolineales bacterium]|nr:hypothetical protein [Anaerolineales bacterium]